MVWNGFFVANFEHISGVSIVNFEHVIAGCVHAPLNNKKLSCTGQSKNKTFEWEIRFLN